MDPLGSGRGSPRLDDATKLVHGRWIAKLYKGSGEAVLYPERVAEAGRKPSGVPGRHPERARAQAAIRARTKVRRYCKANRLFRLLTLTYRDQTEDVDQVVGDVQAFVRRLRRGVLGDRAFAYVWVIERHKSGKLHVHIGLPVFIAKDRLAELWGHGFVDVRRLKVKGRAADSLGASGAAAAYLAKYVGKSYEEERAGRHRYEVGQGFQPEAEGATELEGERGALAWCVWRMDGEAPVTVVRCESAEGWEGPPMRLVFW